jgi:hypothetical protein
VSQNISTSVAGQGGALKGARRRDHTAAAVAAHTFLIVELVDTVDMPDGQPLPPYIDDGVVWHVARPLPGARTRWRRISLAENLRPDCSQVAGAFNSAAATRKK